MTESQSLEPRAGNIQDIQTLRGVSILLVMIAHLPFLFPWADATEGLVEPFGFAYGVDLFFIISGFVISRSLYGQLQAVDDEARPTVIVRFWVRRIFRLWPAAFCVILATLLAVALFDRNPIFAASGDNRTYLAAAAASMFNYMDIWGYLQISKAKPITFLAHYWSLSLEEQFYTVLPFLFLVKRISKKINVISALIILFFVFLDRAQFRGFPWWVRIDGLFWGVALYFSGRDIAQPWRSVSPTKQRLAFFGLIFGIITIPYLFGDLRSASPLTVVVGAALVVIASWDLDLFQSFGLLSKALNYIGERSYTIYLWHVLVFSLAQLLWLRLSGTGGRAPTLVNGTAIVLIALAGLTVCVPFYRWVETPGRALGRRVASKISVPARLPVFGQTLASEKF